MKSSPGSKASALRLGFLAVVLWAGRVTAATLPVAATGATVDETRVTQIFYVDPAHTEAADDDKHGAADLPFATFNYACQAAAKAKDANVGVRIVLAAGTYREAATVPAPAGVRQDTDAPLIIEAAEREQAVIDGADTEGWSPSTWKTEDARWTHPWPFRRSAVLHPATGLPPGAASEAYRRGDLLFINGSRLRQVNTAVELAPGCFWGDLPVVNPRGRHAAPERASGAGPVAIVQPSADTELPGAIIQVGVRPRGLTISGRRNVVVRGLLIQHAAEPGGAGEKTAGLVIEGCSNVLVEDVLSQWNDGSGLEIVGRAGGPASADYTLRRVRLLHNGGSGLSVANLSNLLAEDCETSFNNFRGDWAGWTDPQGPAGVKAEGVHGSAWQRLHVVGNASRGFWLDGGNTDATVEEAVVRDNLITGMCIGSNPGPVLVRRCLVVGTKSPPGLPEGTVFCAGLATSATPDLSLESNVFADNATTQLGLEYSFAKLPMRSERHTYRHNVFYSADANASLYRLPVTSEGGVPGFGSFYATLDSGENCFWTPTKIEGFDAYLYRAANRKPRVPALEVHPYRLEDWQAVAQKEAGPPGTAAKIEDNSRWQDPLFADPAEGNYRLKPSSPAADWNLPADEGSTGL